MKEKRKDLTGREPEVGDFIAYNPPYYKGLVICLVTGFAKSGLPTILDKFELDKAKGETYQEKIKSYLSKCRGNYTGETPKTGFVIVTFP